MADAITKTDDDFFVIRHPELNHCYRIGHTIGSAKGTPVYEAYLVPADASISDATIGSTKGTPVYEAYLVPADASISDATIGSAKGTPVYEAYLGPADASISDATIGSAKGTPVYEAYLVPADASISDATIGSAKGTPVYEACLVPADASISDAIVAVKWVNINQEAEYETAKQEVQRSNLFSHPNILGVKNSFIYNDRFCIIIPNKEVVSIRSIMMSKFKNGLPEDCIAIVLRETLTGLCAIHAKTENHKELNSGNIFYQANGENPYLPESNSGNITIGFSASSYERLSELGQAASHLQGCSIFNWAVAPEVYNSDNNAYSSKADIWLIGITALELAFGTRFQVKTLAQKGEKKNAEEESSSKRNKKKDRLEEILGLLKKRARENHVPSFSIKKSDFGNLSENFKSLLEKCLAEKPTRRSAVKTLLRHRFFHNCKRVDYFRYVVVKAMTRS